MRIHRRRRRSLPAEALVVIVTGAGNGIGRHLTSCLLDAGHHVAALDLDTENLAALDSLHPGRLLPVVADVTDPEAAARAVARTLEEWGRIDVLVNNACVVGVGTFAERGVDALAREMEVNFGGYARMVAAVLPAMTSRGRGVIHNVSSVVGLTGLPRLSAYAASKAAVEAFTRSLAFELRGSGVGVTLVHLPFTATDSARQLGVSPRLMADPAFVARRLAERVLRAGPYVTPDIRTAAWLAASRLLPGTVGRVMALVSERALRDTAPRRPPRPGGPSRRS